ncbi:hypothetical protein [Thermodesulfovibrio sp.]|jgi:flagellar biosynthesis chaperone FliJ|uniref:Flagellar FliJ protein n=2 Tax=Thermodesulfovibrio TaxID=28261 RepID=A0A2J6WLX3_9BACT|nr:MAG: hypothetical protein C0186_03820 [Thermodesulfovibrio aggregans]
MNVNTLNMILRLKEWEEELEKQKFINILSERQKLEEYLRMLEERFSSLDFLKEATSVELLSIYDEMQYLLTQLKETREIIKKIDDELEAQRQVYEEAFKERKKIEQLYDKLISRIKIHLEKLEEKLISDVFLSQVRSK